MRQTALCGVVLVAAVSLGPAGPLAAQEQAEQKTAPAQAKSEVVATYSLGEVTAEELDRMVRTSMAQIEMQAYQLKERTIRQMVAERLLRAEAVRQGKTRDQLYAERVTSKVAEPAKLRVDQVLKQYRAQIPGTDEEARKRVVEALKRQEIQRLENTLRTELLRDAKLRILLEPPRFPVTVTENDPVRGAADAPVTIVEFSDYQCPFCGRVQGTLAQLLKEYDGKIRLVFKQTPSPSHPMARPAAEASVCAGKQGKFWEMHDWLFTHQKELGRETIDKQAAELGLDMEAYTKCVEAHEPAIQINDTIRESQFLGATGTPTFFVNGRRLAGAQPLAAFKTAIDAELAKLGVAAGPGAEAAPAGQAEQPAADGGEGPK